MHKLTLFIVFLIIGLSPGYFKSLSEIEDSFIRDDQNTFNYGGGQSLRVGSQNGGTVETETLIKFPINDSLPAGSVVDSAKWKVWVNAIQNDPQTVNAYIVLADWNAGAKNNQYVAGGVSWDEAKSGTDSWAAPGLLAGTDYDNSSVVGTRVFNASDASYDSIRIEDALNAWLTGTPNYGLVLINPAAPCGSNCRVQLRPSEYVAQPPYLEIWYQIPPQITGPDDAVLINAAQSDSSTVTLNYELYDPDNTVDTVNVEYCNTALDCSNPVNWNAMSSITGDTGAVNSTSPTADKEVFWDVNAELGNNTDASYQLRIIAHDDSMSVDTAWSDTLLIDTRNPVNLAGFAVGTMTETTAPVSWATPAADNHFSHYEIWYAVVQANTEARNASAVEWDNTDDSNLANAATTSTTITGLSYATEYFFKIWGIDSAGNEITLATDSGTTLTSANPQVSGHDPSVTPTGVAFAADSVELQYEVNDLDDSVVTITVETKLASGGWKNWATVKSNMSGDTGVTVTSPSTDRLIIWDLAAQEGSSVEETATIRIIATDSSSNIDTSTSASFTVDSKAPTAPSGLAVGSQTSSSVTLNWTSGADGNFDHYEIWYGTDQAQVESRGAAAEWDNDPQDAGLASAGATSTTITGLLASTTYWFHIWAVDAYGNEADQVASISQTTDATTLIQITDMEDNTMRSSSAGDDNCGGFTTRGGPTAGRNGGAWQMKRSLVKFDLSAIPTGATITQADFTARLNDNGNNNGPQIIDAHNLAVNFVEGTDGCGVQTGSSSWISRGPANWSNSAGGAPGVDYNATATSSQTVDDVGSYTWDLTTIVGQWHSGDTTNNGLLFKERTETGVTGKFFDASEGPIPPFLDVSYVLNPPSVTGLASAALVGATMAGDPDSVTVSFEVSDPNDATVTIHMEYKTASGGSWATATDTIGYVGSQDATNSITDRQIRWGARAALGSVDNNYKVRVIASDGILIDTTESASFAIDTKDPVGLANLNVVAPTPNTINLQWTSVTDETNFNHYEIWFGSNLTDVQNRNPSTATEFDNTDDNGLATANTTSTSITTGINSSTLYYLKIWAVDDIGNEATTVFDSVTTPADAAPTVTGLSAASQVGAIQTDPTTVTVDFEISDTDDDTANCTFDYFEVGVGPWTAATAYTGDSGQIVYTEGQDLSIAWDVGTETLPSNDATYKVRIGCTDPAPTLLSDTTESAQFILDLVSPTGMSGFAIGTLTATTADITWNPVLTENHFSHYEIWYSTVSGDVTARSGTALEWDNGNDGTLATMASNSTTITSLTPSSLYWFKIWGVDSAGNEQTLGMSSGTTLGTVFPVVTGPSDTPDVGASQTTTTTVIINYEVDDSDDTKVSVDAEYCLMSGDCTPGGSWVQLTTTSGDIGEGIATPPTDGKSINWTAATDLSNVEDNYRVRVIANDTSNIDTTNSATFALDTKDPATVGASPSLVEAGGSTMEISWTASSDANFNHYEVWYGTVSAEVTNRNGGAVKWDQGNDANLAAAATTSTIVTGLTVNTAYFWRVWAVDDFGNETDNTSNLSASTLDIKTPAVSLEAADDLGSIQGVSIAGNNLYIGSANVGGGEDNLTKRNAATGAFLWQFSTSAYGSTRPPVFTWDNGVSKYIVHFAAGNRIFAVQDNGGSKTDLFNVDLSGTTGIPFGDPGDNRVAVVAGGDLHLRNYTTGTSAAEWSTNPVTGSFSSDADIVYDTWAQNAIYVGIPNGIDAYNIADGTSLTGSTYSGGSGSVNSALWQMGGFIYVLIGSQLNKINESTMVGAGGNFPVNLAGTGIGLWYDWNTDIIYITTSAGIQALNSDGTVAVAPRALANIASPPTVNGTVVYFGLTGGTYYAVQTSDLTDLTSWPYTIADGDAIAWPAVDFSNTRIIFGTDNENLDAFAQE